MNLVKLQKTKTDSAFGYANDLVNTDIPYPYTGETKSSTGFSQRVFSELQAVKANYGYNKPAEPDFDNMPIINE